MADNVTTATVVVNAVDRLSRPVDRMTNTIRRMNRPVDNLSRSFRDLQQEAGLGRLIRQVTTLGRRVDNLGRSVVFTAERAFPALVVAAAGAAGAGGAVGGMSILTGFVAQATRETERLARNMDISVSRLQAFQFAAAQSGLKAEKFRDALKGLQEAQSEAEKDKTGKQAETFFELGVALRDGKGELKDINELVLDLASAFESIQEPSRFRRLSRNLFGEEGEAFARLLRQGPDELRKRLEEARKTGNVLNKSQVDRLLDFQKAFRELFERIKGLARFMSAEFAPALDRIVDDINAWLAANNQLVRSRISEWVKRLSGFLDALRDPTSKVRQDIRELVESLTSAWSWFRRVTQIVGGPFTATLATTAALIFSPLILAISGLVQSLVTLAVVGIRPAAAALRLLGAGLSRIGAPLQALAALALWAAANPFTALWRSIKGLVRLFTRGLPRALGNAGRAIAALGATAGGVTFASFIAGASVIAGLGIAIWRNWQRLGAFLGGFLDGVMQPLNRVWRDLQEALKPLQPAFDAITDAVSSLWSWFTSLLQPVERSKQELDRAREAGERVGRTFGEFLADAIWAVTFPLRVIARLADDVRAAWSGIRDFFATAFAGLEKIVGAAVGVMKDRLGFDPVAAMRRPWQALAARVRSWLRGAVAAVRRAIGRIGESLAFDPLAHLNAAWDQLAAWIARRLAAPVESARRFRDKLRDVLAWSPLPTLRDAWSGLTAFVDRKLTALAGVVDGFAFPELPAPPVPDLAPVRQAWSDLTAVVDRALDRLARLVRDFAFPDLAAPELPDLTGAGRRMVDGLLAGIKAAWGDMLEWLRGAVDRLQELVPEFLRGQLGIDLPDPAQSAPKPPKPPRMPESSIVLRQPRVLAPDPAESMTPPPGIGPRTLAPRIEVPTPATPEVRVPTPPAPPTPPQPPAPDEVGGGSTPIGPLSQAGGGTVLNVHDGAVRVELSGAGNDRIDGERVAQIIETRLRRFVFETEADKRRQFFG